MFLRIQKSTLDFISLTSYWFSKEKRAGGVKTESDTDQFKDIVMRALAVSNAALNVSVNEF